MGAGESWYGVEMEPAFTATGTRDPADLPHAHRCGARWAGANTAHCGACCRTFVGITAFDRHRKGGVCAVPADIGMVPAPGRVYEVWTMTVPWPEPAPCGRGSETCSRPENCLSCHPWQRT